MHRFFCRHKFQCFRECGTDRFCKGHGDLIRKPRCHIGFMDHNRNPRCFCPQHNRNRHKAALGKYHIGSELPQQRGCLCNSLQHTEHILKIFSGSITTQFPCGNTEIRYAHFLDQFFFHTVLRADIHDFPAFSLQKRNQCNIRCNMSGSTAARQYNTFTVHISDHPFSTSFFPPFRRVSLSSVCFCRNLQFYTVHYI